MTLYDAVAALPLAVERVERTTREADTSSGFVRTTTTFHLHGPDGATGMGEDVTYDTEDHDRLAAAGLDADLTGEHTFGEFSAMLDDVSLFPEPPERETGYDYRRWAVESAALDLACRQAGETLATVLDRRYDPVRFVVSTRLEEGDPGRVHDLLDSYPDSEFKLDPTAEWTESTVEALVETGRVRVLDLKGQYHGTVVDAEPDAELYARIAEAFDGAVLEDPAITDETAGVVESVADRLSWDAPIHGLEDVHALPYEPSWLNIKPSRFGSVASLFETVEWCLAEGVTMYGGGQFELGVGRGQIQALASLFYPDGPNDVAPGGYNDPEVPVGLPTSPLTPPDEPHGFRW